MKINREREERERNGERGERGEGKTRRKFKYNVILMF